MTQKLIQENAAHDAIEDTFTLSGTLGSGATSTVRKCTHKLTGDVFACKTLALNRLTPDMRKTLACEVKIMKSLDHPNIVKLRSTFVEPYTLHIVMECCAGGELFDRLVDNPQPKGHFTEHTTQRYCIQMASALKYLHDSNIVHRDLKLENFLLTTNKPNAEIKVIDFGMSRSYLEGESFDQMCGTVYYLAPEVVDTRISYTEASDMWSFGVIVFAMLSGGLPFGGFGMTDAAILNLILQGTFHMTGKKWTHVSAEAKDFVASLLVTDPAKRMSAGDALKHVFLTMRIQEKQEKDVDVGSLGKEGEDVGPVGLPVHALRQFREYSVFKRLVLSIIAFNLGEQDVAAMRSMFKEFDVEKNGVVTFAEFTQVMTAHGVMKDDEIQRVFASLDQDHTGVVKYSEFISACVDETTMLNEQRILDAFNTLDSDKTGHLSKENLREFLGDVDDVSFAKMFAEVDVAGDNVVHLSEFRSMLLKKSGDF